jgi:ankyrin repeat protein
MDDFLTTEKSLTSTEVIDSLNEGIIKCIETSGVILPSSLLKNSSQCDCQWTEYASVTNNGEGDSLISCSPVSEDIRQQIPLIMDVLQTDELVGSNGRPVLYACCLGLLLSKRKSSEERINNNSNTPLSTFLSIATVLFEDFEVDPDEPTQTVGACHRPPLHLLARSCYPEAVKFLIDKGADVNITDDEGWTALMACCLPDIQSEEKGGPTDEERVATIEVMMNAGRELNVNAQNYCGYTAMHYACESLNLALIQFLLGKADTTMKSIWGESVMGIVLSQSDRDPEKAAICEAVLMSHFKAMSPSDPIHVYLEDERKSINLKNLVDNVMVPASRRDEILSNSVDKGSLMTQDNRIISALLNHLKLDPSILFDFNVFDRSQNESKNIYEVIHSRILDLIPSALVQVYCNRNPTNDERGIVTSTNHSLRNSSEIFQDGVRRIDPSLLMSQAFYLHRQRGHISRQVELLNNLFVGPLQRTFSFAVPSNSVLQQIIQLAPRIVEVGAGTGYWSYILSKLGADIIAFDSNPLMRSKDAKSCDDDNVYFGSQSYYLVQYGIASSIFDGASSDIADRALLIVWPNNPDAIDNPHVAVDDANLPKVWDFECLQRYYDMGGKTVIYVGERNANIELISTATAPDWGFCASKMFQQFLETNFQLTASLENPKWWMKEDDVTVWSRY